MISLLPFWALNAIAHLAFFFLYYVFGYRKKVVLENLKSSFPNESKKQIVSTAKKFFKHFCRSFIESLKLLTLLKKKFGDQYHLTNPEVLTKSLEEGRSVMLYGSHFGNWEWMTYLPSQIECAMFSFYRKVSNGYFNDFMIHMRQRFGNICIESEKGPRTIIQNQRKNVAGLYYLIGDQSPNKSSSFKWFNFLNQETAFLMGAPKLAKRFEMDSFYAQVKTEKTFHYEITFVPFPKEISEDEMAEFYVKELEKNIRAQKHLWLWSHKRWKMKKE
ncbi:MAG: lysophospholipid acyltransferase family protein [Bacteroidota bacterium]